MVLKNHIAYRFLHDESILYEMCGETHAGDWKKLEEKVKEVYDSGKTTEEVQQHLNDIEFDNTVLSFLNLTRPNNQKAYYVTETVLEKLDMLKINKKDKHYNWMVFKNLSPQKITLILPDNKVLRVYVSGTTIQLFWLTFKKHKEPGTNLDGNMKWVMLYFYTDTGELCEHFEHPDSYEIEEFIYKLMCFFYLTENDELIVAPGKTHGTKKQGKLLNNLEVPVTVVNSRWNTTVIRTEQFGVRGHFRVQPCGEGRKNYEIIFIDPFVKNGYKRTAGKIKEGIE